MTLTPEEINELADILEANDGGQELRAKLRQAASELSALQKEVAHLKSNVSPVDYKWAFENLEREMVKLIDNAVAAEIERLQTELSALQKENAELKEKNVAWALGIEQSNTDIVDMQRDEFMRIKALLHASESPSDREIIGICNRAIACIEQTVPVVVQRDGLEKEVASLRTQSRELREACVQFIAWYHVDPFKGDKHWKELPDIIRQAEQAIALQPEK